MPLEMRRLYVFGAFRLDPVERCLRRGERLVPLPPKALEALLALVESDGRVLERNILIKRIWPDGDADESNLAVTISLLRKALGDRPDSGPYIETVPRQGYRFAASVKQSVGDPGSSLQADAGAQDLDEDPANGVEAKARVVARSALLDWLATYRKALVPSIIVIVLTGAAWAGYVLFIKRGPDEKKAQPRSLAILPFRNLKPDEQTDFLGFSLADATITRLRSVGSIVVRPSSSVEKYRGKDADPQRVASELKVDTLLTGTYMKEGPSLKATIELIDVNSGEVLSRLTMETRYERLVTVQDEVAQNIIDRLHLNLTFAEAQQLGQKGTDSPSAYEYYLRGIDMYSRNEFLPSVPLLEKAVEIDPNFALGWAHLGRAYNACASFNLRGREHHLKAQAAYEQALTLNPSLIETSIFMANMFTDTGRPEQAVPLLRRLLAVNPNIAEARWELGYAYRFAGMLTESIDECARARATDPSVKINSSAFNSYLYTGQYEKFLDSLPQGDPSAFIVFYKGMGNYYLKRLEQAAADFDRAYEIDPQLYARVGKALSYHVKHERLVAIDLLRDVEREIQERSVGDAEGTYKVAQGYAVCGEKESALRVFRQSIEQGFFCYEYFKSDPLLESVRNDPEFARLLETARLRHEQFKNVFLGGQ